MSMAAELACPSCKRSLVPEAWADASRGTCPRCDAAFEFIGFPALTPHKVSLTPQLAELSADSVCFFHAENRAEAVCESCGRFVCSVCNVPFGNQRLCPSCISGSKNSDDAHVRSRILYDQSALAVAGLPLLIWPLTLVTAPLALGLVVYGWKKPGSVVRGQSRVRLVIAALLAVLQVTGWTVLFVYMAVN